MKKWLHHIELTVDRLIPILLVLLFGVLIIQFFFHEIALKYELYIAIFDYILISAFIIDLIFKYFRIRNIPRFLRESWMDIIAIFPFFLVFRVAGAIGLLGVSVETTAETQKVLHIGVGVEKELTSALKEGSIVAEEVSQVGRSERFSRFLRPLSNTMRFFELGDKNVQKDVKQDIKSGEELLKEGEDILKKEGKVLMKPALFYEKPGISFNHFHKKKA